MKDLIRTVFSIRQKRRSPPAGPVPPAGTQLIRGEIRMTVDQNIPRELWSWMLLSGWRAIPVKKALQRLNTPALEAALRHAGKIDRLVKGIGHGNVWEEFLRLGFGLCRPVSTKPV